LKIRHQNGDIFKDVLNKKGVENFNLSNGISKSIANVRETIPLKMFDIFNTTIIGSANHGYKLFNLFSDKLLCC
jgi:hypothetical protein